MFLISGQVNGQEYRVFKPIGAKNVNLRSSESIVIVPFISTSTIFFPSCTVRVRTITVTNICAVNGNIYYFLLYIYFCHYLG